MTHSHALPVIFGVRPGAAHHDIGAKAVHRHRLGQQAIDPREGRLGADQIGEGIGKPDLILAGSQREVGIAQAMIFLGLVEEMGGIAEEAREPVIDGFGRAMAGHRAAKQHDTGALVADVSGVDHHRLQPVTRDAQGTAQQVDAHAGQMFGLTLGDHLAFGVGQYPAPVADGSGFQPARTDMRPLQRHAAAGFDRIEGKAGDGGCGHRSGFLPLPDQAGAGAKDGVAAGRKASASAICAAPVASVPARSATVRATRSTR